MPRRLHGSRHKNGLMEQQEANEPVCAAPSPEIIRWSPTDSRYPPGFYTYELIDPRSGLPFYVGKGQRDRAWEHERQVRAGQRSGNARKVERILDISKAGLAVEVRIAAVFVNEADALDLEFKLVDRNPTLTNVMPGGIGPAETPTQIERRRLIRADKLAAARERDRIAALQRDTERKRIQFHGLAITDRHRSEIDAWVESFSEAGARIRLNSGPLHADRKRQAQPTDDSAQPLAEIGRQHRPLPPREASASRPCPSSST